MQFVLFVRKAIQRGIWRGGVFRIGSLARFDTFIVCVNVDSIERNQCDVYRNVRGSLTDPDRSLADLPDRIEWANRGAR